MYGLIMMLSVFLMEANNTISMNNDLGRKQDEKVVV
jgi:hypothetical protein